MKPLLRELPEFKEKIENNLQLKDDIISIFNDYSDYSYSMEQTVLTQPYFNDSADKILRLLIDFVNENYTQK